MAAPPVARKAPQHLKVHGDLRVDNYYWLRDDRIHDDLLPDGSRRFNQYRSDVLAHLNAENDYTKSVMSELLARSICTVELSSASMVRLDPLLHLASPCPARPAVWFSEKTLALLSKLARLGKVFLASAGEPNRLAGSDVKQLEVKIFKEIEGRSPQVGIVGAPVRKGQYYYYERKLAGKEYVQHCRRHVPNDGPITVHDVMPTGPDAPAEHIILDENVKAEGHGYYRIGAFKVSPNNKLVAYAEDTKGNEIYTGYVIDAESVEDVGQPLKGIASDIEWADDDQLIYISKVSPNNKLYVGQPVRDIGLPDVDESYFPLDVVLTPDNTLRAHKAWLRTLAPRQSRDTPLYHEEDPRFSLHLKDSESGRYIFVESRSKNTSFVFFLDKLSPAKRLLQLTPRVYGTGTTASHRGNHFFINRRSVNSYNSELVACPLDNVDETTILLPHRESVKIQDFKLFINHIVVDERENGLPKVTVYPLPPIGQPIGKLQEGRTIDFICPEEKKFVIDPTYAVDLDDNQQFHSSIIRFHYSSMRTPPSDFDYDMNSEVSVLKMIANVLDGFDASNYVTERKWAVAADGTQIPMSILYRKDLVKLDGSDPMLLYGYGAYEACYDPRFCAPIFSVVDRGFIYVIAHIRGGGEMGRKWYEDGKLLKKKNTFTDFIACAEHLIENKYCSKEKLCIDGRSAGGLLMGAVLNMRPDLFKAAVARVPFVDVITTMLDATLPLTTMEWEEWGDPREEEYYYYMKSYSPVDNVTAQEYPNILVTAGLLDNAVRYFEPAKFVAKLRELKTNDNLLLLKCDFNAGHVLERSEKLKEDAFIYTFILKALGMTSEVASSSGHSNLFS
ncbi:hypothetical protein ACP70R_043759 [Stipagrostis hirtigluma subsp. patula]